MASNNEWGTQLSTNTKINIITGDEPDIPKNQPQTYQPQEWTTKIYANTRITIEPWKAKPTLTLITY